MIPFPNLSREIMKGLNMRHELRRNGLSDACYLNPLARLTKSIALEEAASMFCQAYEAQQHPGKATDRLSSVYKMSWGDLRPLGVRIDSRIRLTTDVY